MDSLNLSDFFTTKGQATDFLSRLATLSEMIYKTDFNLETSLMGLLGIQKKDKFLTLLRENNISSNSAGDLKNFIITLQTTITKLPVFSLTIAFEPTEQTLKVISEWFVMNLKKQAIFDFIVDPSIIAGAIINYNGKFKDYSFKNPVKQMLTTLLEPQNKKTLQTNQQTSALTEVS